MSPPSSVCGVPPRVQPHQLGDAVLGVEDRATAGLGRMGGDDRRDERAGQRLGHRRRIQIRRIQLLVGGGQAAVLRWVTRLDVDGAAAFPVDVFGDVGQQREVTERPDHRDCPADVDAVENLRHLGRARSRSDAPGTTRCGPAPPGRRPRHRSAHERCRRGWHRATGCRRASARLLRDLFGCVVPRRRARASRVLQPYLPVSGWLAVFAFRGVRRCI